MIDVPNPRARRHLAFAAKLALAIVGVALLLSVARRLGWVDQAMVVRAINVAIGLGLAAYGNAMPKFMHESPPRTLAEATLQQAVARVAGWVMTLAFLAWAAFWAFAPADVAWAGSMAAVASAGLVMLAYVGWKCRPHRR